jgi:WD40 repeat protein
VQAAAAGGKSVKVFSVNDGKEVLTLAHPAGVSALSFSGDRTRLATAGADGKARVWDLATRKELQGFLHGRAVHGVAFHPAVANQVVSAGADRRVDVHTITAARLVVAGTPVHGLAVSPNSQHVLTAGEDGQVKLWNTSNGNNDRTCPGGGKPVAAVAVSRTSQLIAAGGADGKVRVYGYNDVKLLVTLTAPAAVRGLAFSPNNQALVAACADGTLQTWNVAYNPGQPLSAEFGKSIQAYRHGKEAAALAFPTAGAVFYSAGEGGPRAWKLASEAPVRTLNYPNSVNAVAFGPRGARLATGSSDGRLRIIDVAKGTILRDVVGHKVMNRTAIYCLAWSPDGKQVVTGGHDQTLKLWDAASGNLVREFRAYNEKTFPKGHQDSVLSVVFTPDGKQVLSAGMDKTIKVWNIADGSVVRELSNPALKAAPGGPAPAHPGWVYALRLTADGKRLLSAGSAPRLRGYLALWDVASGKMLSGREMNVGTVFALAVSPDGTKVALGTGGSVRAETDLNLGVVLKMPAGTEKK